MILGRADASATAACCCSSSVNEEEEPWRPSRRRPLATVKPERRSSKPSAPNVILSRRVLATSKVPISMACLEGGRAQLPAMYTPMLTSRRESYGMKRLCMSIFTIPRSIFQGLRWCSLA